MIRINREPHRASTNDLQRVIEPLASYICASDRPPAALSLAFAALANEVTQLNRVAFGHVNRLLHTMADR
jgi:hypothetical protein